MRSLVVFGLLVLLIVGTTLAADGETHWHRFCGDHGDCVHTDKDRPQECCLRGKMNGYHECLPNPSGQPCKASDLN